MDFDKGFIAALLREGKPSLKKAYARGLTVEHLAGGGRTAFEFIVGYEKQYGELPSVEVVCHATQTALDSAISGTADYFVNCILDRRLDVKLTDLFRAGVAQLEAEKPREALRVLEEGMAEFRKERLVGTLIESLPGLGPEVLSYYERVKKGMTGILSPWESINRATMGFWPEDLVLFVSRLGVGKTWLSLMVAGCAWEQQITEADGVTKRPVRVLYATTEMAKARIALRWYALKLKLPYGMLRQGRLGAHMEKALYDGVERFVNSPDFQIVGGDFDFSMTSFDAAVEEANPDIVVLDGAYLLKVAGNTRTERAANVFDELKRLNKRRKVPIVVTMQFNREVKAGQVKTVQAESVALTDVAGWNADLMYGLVQTDDMRQTKTMALKGLKVREGESGEIECN
jgi:replicative DNA helicase